MDITLDVCLRSSSSTISLPYTCSMTSYGSGSIALNSSCVLLAFYGLKFLIEAIILLITWRLSKNSLAAVVRPQSRNSQQAWTMLSTPLFPPETEGLPQALYQGYRSSIDINLPIFGSSALLRTGFLPKIVFLASLSLFQLAKSAFLAFSVYRTSRL